MSFISSFISNINFFHLALIMTYDAMFFLMAPVTFGLFSTSLANMVRKAVTAKAPSRAVAWGIARRAIPLFSVAMIPFVTLCVIANWQTIVAYLVIGTVYGMIGQKIFNAPINHDYNQAKILAALS